MKSRTLIIAVLCVALAAGILWFIGFMNKEAESNHNWQRTLHTDGSEPYDLSVFYKSLKITWADTYHEIPANSTLDEISETAKISANAIYFFIGKNLYLSDGEENYLEQFVHNGGTVFISSNNIPETFYKNFGALYTHDIEYVSSDSIQLRFRNKTLNKNFQFVHYVKNKSATGTWHFFKSTEINAETQNIYDTESPNVVITLSELENNATDFICLNYGLGRLYLHANPVFFSNYYLRSEAGREYFKQVVQHLPKTPLWMDLSGSIRKENSKTGNQKRASLYDFIASDKALKNAWWILLVGIFSFLLFAGKRQQRLIPVIEPPKNNTLTFVDTIGQFYFNEKSNLSVYRREWNQFLLFIKNNFRYQLKDLNRENAEIISQRSGVPVEVLLSIFAMHGEYESAEKLTASELIATNKLIHSFYLEYNNKNGK